MTTEFLLDALGLLDDGLILDAEEHTAARDSVPGWRRWGAWAACLALAAALGYGVTHLGAGGGYSTGAGGLANNSSAASSTPAAPAGSASAGGGESSSQSVSGGAAVLPGAVYLDGAEYRLTGELLEDLPQGAEVVGVLSAGPSGGSGPSTNIEEYVGCALWQTPDGLLCLQLPQGGYAPAQPVSP